MAYLDTGFRYKKAGEKVEMYVIAANTGREDINGYHIACQIDDGEVVTVPEREGIINVAWNIYEFAALQIPLRHVHPDGECKVLLPTSSEEEKTDPRWDALNKLANRK